MTVEIPAVLVHLGIALLVLGAIWWWNRWDCLRRPGSRPPRRWYFESEDDMFGSSRWDLRDLNRRFPPPEGMPPEGVRARDPHPR